MIFRVVADNSVALLLLGSYYVVHPFAYSYHNKKSCPPPFSYSPPPLAISRHKPSFPPTAPHIYLAPILVYSSVYKHFSRLSIVCETFALPSFSRLLVLATCIYVLLWSVDGVATKLRLALLRPTSVPRTTSYRGSLALLISL